MYYNDFVLNITNQEEHHGKLLIHLQQSDSDIEEYKLYRFCDFIKFAKADLLKYENFELKNNVLYNFQLFIHAPDAEMREQQLRQHSTTMALLYKITGGRNIKVKKDEKIKIVVYDRTVWDKECKITTTYTNIKNPKKLFTFNENEIIRVLDDSSNFKTLHIYKSEQIPYFNFSTNNIIPTDKWKIPNSLTKKTHHSIAYIVNNRLFYKFPDDSTHQSINFNVYLTNNCVYHRCLLTPESSKYIYHYNSNCCTVSEYLASNSELKSFVEDINDIRTIRHYKLNDVKINNENRKYILMNNRNNDKYKEMFKICEIQRRERYEFTRNNIYLIKFVDSLQ